MSSPAWLSLDRALADTGIFILWYRGKPNAKLFFRNPNIQIYYSRVTRKELLRSPIRDVERRRSLPPPAIYPPLFWQQERCRFETEATHPCCMLSNSHAMI
jgi:hypothetical protein